MKGLDFLDGNHFFAFVSSAVEADVMRELRLKALRAGAQIGTA